MQNDIVETEEDVEETVWGPTRRISDHALRQIARKHLGAFIGDRCWVSDTLEGAYNRVFIIKFDVGEDDGRKYVIRVPSCGTKGRWNEHDAIALRSQARTMMFIKRKTKVPIPEVLAYDTSCENALGHPYILMTFLEGVPVHDLWNDEDMEDGELEGRRQRILKSVAFAMAELRHLSFNAKGMLYFEDDDDDNPYVGPQYEVDEGDIGDPQQGYKHQTSLIPEYTDTKKAINADLDRWWKVKALSRVPDADVGKQTCTGLIVIMGMIADVLPRSYEFESVGQIGGPKITEFSENGEYEEDEQSSCYYEVESDGSKTEDEDEQQETFVLAPPDLDSQNILIDPVTLTVTGLIDWDWVHTVPRFNGWSAIPLFLSQDWVDGYAYDPDDCDTPEDLERWRKDYASYIAEACRSDDNPEGTKGDARFTAKNHLYDALNSAVKFHSMTSPMMERFLRPILGHTDMHRYLTRLGDRQEGGFREGERVWLKDRLRELFSVG